MAFFNRKKEEEEVVEVPVPVMISRLYANYYFVRNDNGKQEEHKYFFDFDSPNDAKQALKSLEDGNSLSIDNKVFDIKTEITDKQFLSRDIWIIPAEKGSEA